MIPFTTQSQQTLQTTLMWPCFFDLEHFVQIWAKVVKSQIWADRRIRFYDTFNSTGLDKASFLGAAYVWGLVDQSWS